MTDWRVREVGNETRSRDLNEWIEDAGRRVLDDEQPRRTCANAPTPPGLVDERHAAPDSSLSR
jgi:hypothetical protein